MCMNMNVYACICVCVHVCVYVCIRKRRYLYISYILYICDILVLYKNLALLLILLVGCNMLIKNIIINPGDSSIPLKVV